jgi:OOP family OmpA-OmpF porin
MKKSLLVAASAAALFAAQAHAQGQSDRLYLGGGIGYSKITESFADSSLAVPAATSSVFTSKRTDTAAQAFIGFKLSPHIALEAGYLSLGKFGGRRDVFAPVAGTVDLSWKVRGVFTDLRVIWPMFDRFALHGKIGVIRANTQARLDNFGTVTEEDGNRLALRYGIGAQYDLTQNFALRADAEVIKRGTNRNLVNVGGDTIDYNLISGSAILKF